MRVPNRIQFWTLLSILFAGLIGFSPVHGVDDELRGVAFPERFSIRAGYYFIEDADTEVAVLDSTILAAGVSLNKTLGVDDRESVPRLDMAYRFNARHAMEFGYFKFDRTGKRRIGIDVEIGDEVYFIGEEVLTKTEYELIRAGYTYSFYHSPKVELAISVGLNISRYDFDFSLSDGSRRVSSGTTAPLPMTGLRMGYKLNDNWSIYYQAESFFVDFDDEISGTLLNNEVNLQYKFNSGLALGFGLTRVGSDLDYDGSKGRGRISDTHTGYLLFGSYYFK